MKTNAIDLGIEIKRQRKAQSLTQHDLSHSSTINIRTIQRAEKGIRIGPFTLRKILEALNLDVLSTIKRFHIEENEESGNTVSPAPKEFNPDRWMAEFELRQAKHLLWGIEIRDEIEQFKNAQIRHFDNNIPFEVIKDRLEELYCASEAHSEEAEELANEEDAIHSFDWNLWELQKEMEASEIQRVADAREIAEQLEYFKYK